MSPVVEVAKRVEGEVLQSPFQEDKSTRSSPCSKDVPGSFRAICGDTVDYRNAPLFPEQKYGHRDTSRGCFSVDATLL